MKIVVFVNVFPGGLFPQIIASDPVDVVLVDYDPETKLPVSEIPQSDGRTTPGGSVVPQVRVDAERCKVFFK